MDIPITFTFGQLVAGFLGTCGAIAAVGVAITWVIKAVKAWKKPSEDKEQHIEQEFEHVHKRIDKVEEKVATSCAKYDDLVRHYHKTALVHDDAINALMEGNKLLLEVQRASIDFKLNDGTDKTKLQDMDRRLDEYLSKRAFGVKLNSGWEDEDVE